MKENEKKVKIAVNGGIDFGSKLNQKQLVTIAKYLKEDDTLELTTFQQLYLEVPEEKKEEIIQELKQVGLFCYMQRRGRRGNLFISS
jgi:sulfite reductase beta subunit-like hemoprotein